MKPTEKKWNDLTPAARKWLRGWILVMDESLNQKVVWHDKIDDSMLFYFNIPQFLTRDQFDKTAVGKEVKVDWDNNGFLVEGDENEKT